MELKKLLMNLFFLRFYFLVTYHMENNVQFHHSWNSNNRMTSYLTYNLARHSDHHVHAQKEFWELNPCDNEGVVLPSLTFFFLRFSRFTLNHKWNQD